MHTLTKAHTTWHFAVVDADPSENPADLEDRSPRTHVFDPTPEQRDAGAIVAFVHRAAEGWTASGTIADTSRGPAVRHLELDPGDSGDSVTAKMLRAVPLTSIINTAASSAGVLEAVRRLHAGQQLEPAQPRRPGRTPLPDELLQRVAVLYLEETAAGKPRGAVGRVAERMGKDSGTLSRWVHQARRRGWLGPAIPGREGGAPGPRLLAGEGATGAAVPSVLEQTGDLEVRDGGDSSGE